MNQIHQKPSSLTVARADVTGCKEKARRIATIIKQCGGEKPMGDILGYYIAYSTPMPSSEVDSVGMLLAGMKEDAVQFLHHISSYVVVNQRQALSIAERFFTDRYNLIHSPIKALYISKSANCVCDSASTVLYNIFRELDK